MVLLHGIAASHAQWNELVPALAAAGYRVYAVDLPGHGDSFKPRDPAAYIMQSIYATLETWMEGMDFAEPPVLVGHSLGGYLSLRYALGHPGSLRGLILLSPFYTQGQLSPALRLLSRHPDFSSRTLRAMPEWLIRAALRLTPDHAQRYSRQNARDLKRASPHILHTPHSGMDLTPFLSSIPTQTLVVWGERDLTLRPASFPRLVRLLPNARGRPVRGCGHTPHLSRPDLVLHDMLEFICLLINPNSKS